MPSKTIYVSDDDAPLYRRAQELAGGNLSAAISAALRRYVEIQEGREKGYDEVIVQVGPGKGRKQRFPGVLLGEWGRTTAEIVEVFRVYGTRSGKYVVHHEHSGGERAAGPGAEKWSTGWRGWVGNWSSDQTWISTPAESTLRISSSLEELRDVLPTELYTLVADAAEAPVIEDLDI